MGPKNTSPDHDSFVKVVADVDEENDQFKIEVRIYNNYNGSSWMSELEEHIVDTPLVRVGLLVPTIVGPISLTRKWGQRLIATCTCTIQDKLGDGLLGSVTDVILGNIFSRSSASVRTSRSRNSSKLEFVTWISVSLTTRKVESTITVMAFSVSMSRTLSMRSDEFSTANPKEIAILDFNHLFSI